MTWARVLVCLSVCVAALAFAQPDHAMAVYEQGKALYDAKDYAGALEKFDAAIALEPSKARWHYNRGLALKKLKRDDDARAALLKSRELEPDYKRKEIDEKLYELGVPPSPGSAAWKRDDDFPVGRFLVVAGLFAAFIIFIIFRAIKMLNQVSAKGPPMESSRAPGRPSNASAPSGAQLAALLKRLTEEAMALGSAEHGLSLGEDPEARGHVDRAATNLATVRKGLATGRPGPELFQSLDRARDATAAAKERLLTLHGERALSVVGPRAGCFFCARALPTPKAGVSVQLKSAQGATTVAACPTCARRVASGQPPPVLMVDGDQRRHWAELDEFNPYVQAHAPPSNAVEVPAWNVMNAGAGLAPLATIAGGAVLGALGVAAVGRLLDLESLRQSDLASAAARASAQAATGRRTTEYSDHS